ncbi:MAG TPA: winged helix-turn-helix domain-containing protein [Rhizomicrobium sp.]|nr:winged helix-turn-helix domain-containing protein [Rhizomicrobium sp.]
MKVQWDNKVGLPETGSVAIWLHHFLYLRAKPVEPKEMYDQLADHFGLDTRQRHAMRHTTSEPAWHNRVQTAREHLRKLGYLDGSQFGLWSLTPDGIAAAKKQEPRLSESISDL